MAIKKLPLRLHPSAIASRHRQSTMASHAAPRSVKNRGSIKAANQQQVDVAGGWRCTVPGKAALHDCLRGQSTWFASPAASCSYQQRRARFPTGDFCFRLCRNMLVLNLWLTPRAASAALSPPREPLAAMPATRISPPLNTLSVRVRLQTPGEQDYIHGCRVSWDGQIYSHALCLVFPAS